MAEDDGFLGRWSRRKAMVRQGLPAEAEVTPPVPPTAGSAAMANAARPAVQPAPAPAAAPSPDPVSPDPAVAAAPAPLTLDDVAALQAQDDFSPFVSRAVAPEVRNAAMKKLFADPAFNVMDGLDIYIDDYSRPDPLPASMARRLLQDQMARVLDPNGQQSAPEGDAPVGDAAQPVTESALQPALEPMAAAEVAPVRTVPHTDAVPEPASMPPEAADSPTPSSDPPPP